MIFLVFLFRTLLQSYVVLRPSAATDCTFEGRNISSGDTIEAFSDVRPRCAECKCENGYIVCQSTFVVNMMHHLSYCRGDCSSFSKRMRSVCSHPQSLSCDSGMTNVTWFQDGCKYACNDSSLQTTFINPKWCQRFISDNEYCVRSCPDRDKVIQLFGNVLTFCRQDEQVFYRHEICDGVFDCNDHSDEENCTQVYCRTEKTSIYWKKQLNVLWSETSVGSVASVDCSLLSKKWTGKITRSCLAGNESGISSRWGPIDECNCQPVYPSEFILEDNWRPIAAELVLAAERLRNITYKAMYSDIYMGGVVDWIKVANITTWNDTNSLSKAINDIWYTIGNEVMCSSKDKAELLEISWEKVNDLASSAGLETRRSPSNVITKGGAFVFSSIDDVDLNIDINKLANQVRSKVEMLNTSVKSKEIEKAVAKLEELQQKLQLQRTLLHVELATTGCSVFSVAFILWVFYAIRIANSMRIFLHKNLLVAYGLHSLMYIVGVLATQILRESRIVCASFVTLLYYFTLAMFTWMLLEGFHLIMIVIMVFQARKNFFKQHMLIGWGVPLIVNGAIFAADPQPFIESKSCLNLGKDVWKIKVPILSVIVMNFVIATIVVATIVRRHAIGEKQLKTLSMSAIKAFLVLAPMLGFLWIFSLLIDEHIAFAFLASTLNGLTGVGFLVFHCILDKQVKEKSSRSDYAILKRIYGCASANETSSQAGGATSQNFQDTPPLSRKSNITLTPECLPDVLDTRL